MKKFKSFAKWFIGILALIIALSFVFDYDYILKGVRVVYFTGHTSAFIDDYPYFENDTIYKSNQTDTWPLNKTYNEFQPTERLVKTHSEFESVAYLVIKNDSLYYEWYADGYNKKSKIYDKRN